MRTAEQVFNETFSGARMPRSQIYRDGMMDGLHHQFEGFQAAKSPYASGTVEADAWWAGWEEGRMAAVREMLRAAPAVVEYSAEELERLRLLFAQASPAGEILPDDSWRPCCQAKALV